MARLGRGRRIKALIRRAPSLTTATPLIRRRLFVSQQGNERSRLRATNFKRRVPDILRAKLGVYRPPRQIVGTQGNERSRVVISRKRHKTLYTRGVRFVTTVTVVRKRQAVTQQGNERSRVTMFRRHRAVLVRAARFTTPTPFVRKSVVVARRRLRIPRTATVVIRSRLAPAAVVFVRPKLVVSKRVTRRQQVRRARPELLRALLWSHRPRPVLVVHRRRSVTRKRRGTALRPTPRQVVLRRPPVPVRGRVRTRVRPRQRAYIGSAVQLGSTAPPVVITTSFYDLPSPDDAEFVGTPVNLIFDNPNPRQV